jgi:fructokinase
MQKTLVAFGELLWDLLPSGRALGGAPGNFAYRVNSLGDNGILISRVGSDPLGQDALQKIQELGMDSRYIQTDEQAQTGTVHVRVDQSGSPDFTITPEVAYDNIELSGELMSLVSPADCLCYGTLAQRAPKSRATLRALIDAAPDPVKLLDLNLRKDCHSLDTIHEALRRADIVKLNEQEANYLAGQFQVVSFGLPELAEEILVRWELSHCLITLGERGAYVATRAGQKVYSPGFKVNLVDTCGAGDAFTAGFTHQLLRGEPLPECLRVGNALGALVASQAGATEPISRMQIDDFLSSRPEQIYDEALRGWEVG